MTQEPPSSSHSPADQPDPAAQPPASGDRPPMAAGRNAGAGSPGETASAAAGEPSRERVESQGDRSTPATHAAGVTAKRDDGYGPPSLQDLQREYIGVGKRLLIGLLRAIVRLLQRWIVALEAPPRRAQPSLSPSPPGELAADSSALARRDPGAPPVLVAPSLGGRLRTAAQQAWEVVRPAAARAWEIAKPYWDKGWNWWIANALPKLRAALPQALNEALTDRALSGAIASVLALLFFVVPNLLPSQEPTRITEPPLISEAPPDGRRVE
ncbi:MAG: hypothetical protein D6742_11605, partial [Cyanobacteria bacterium J069]